MVDLKAIEFKIEQINEKLLAEEPNSPEPHTWQNIRRNSSAGSRLRLTPTREPEMSHEATSL